MSDFLEFNEFVKSLPKEEWKKIHSSKFIAEVSEWVRLGYFEDGITAATELIKMTDEEKSEFFIREIKRLEAEYE